MNNRGRAIVQFGKLALAGLALAFVSGCALIPNVLPQSQERAFPGAQSPEYDPLYNWSNATSSSIDPASCVRYHTADPSWGQVIGCQELETIDARSPEVLTYIDQRLRSQACYGICEPYKSVGPDGAAAGVCKGASIARPMVRSKRHFMVVDKETRTVWYVPGDYYSDGLSIPRSLTRFLAGSAWDTASPQTLPAALAHDRSFCLRQYSEEWNTSDAVDAATEAAIASRADQPTPYRRRGCANNAFQNTLRMSGTANFVNTIMRTAVSLANPEREGYCPLRQYNYVALLEAQFGGDNPEGTDFTSALKMIMRDCRPGEPTVLCLSDRDNLRDVVRAAPLLSSPEAGVPADWLQLATRIFCLDHNASRLDRIGRDDAVESDDALCAAAGLAPPSDTFSSPVRAGDFWIEAAPRLYCQRPELLLASIESARDIDNAVVRMVRWNQSNLVDQMDGDGRRAFLAANAPAFAAARARAERLSGDPDAWMPCVGVPDTRDLTTLAAGTTPGVDVGSESGAARMEPETAGAATDG